MEVFKKAGQVLSIHITKDRQTGKPKTAHCEYPDIRFVNTAVKNLDGYEFKGQKLSVVKADDSGSKKKEQQTLQNIKRTSRRNLCNLWSK